MSEAQKSIWKKILGVVGNLKGLIFFGVIYAFSCGYATIIENDFGRATANVRIYHAWWFELIQVILLLTLLVNIFNFKMWKLKKWTVFFIHISLFFILIGGTLTRYFGVNGNMRIREGASSNIITVTRYDNKIMGVTELPFSVKLTDFKLARYPGNNAPSTYESYVEIFENDKLVMPFHIYMNHILVYKGYRFYQSSYDRDELGTVLAVTKDPGMWPTYIGYFILFFGFFINLFDRNSLFQRLSRQNRKIQEKKASLLSLALLLVLSFPSIGAELVKIDDYHADRVFGILPVQSHSGRVAPFDSLSYDILNKITKKTSLHGMTHNQSILSLYINDQYWMAEPLIYVAHPEVKKLLGADIRMKRISYNILFNDQGQYKLGKESEAAQGKPPNKRGTLDKEILKLNERVNVLYMVFKGHFFKFFPHKQGDLSQWLTFGDLENPQAPQEYKAIRDQYRLAIINQNWDFADKIIRDIGKIQIQNSGDIVPNKDKVAWELLFNRWHIFQRLPLFIGLLGFILLVISFTTIFSPKYKVGKLGDAFHWMAITAFIVHTFGLALRWYISGHTPISNGYESMVFIAWATLLAGLILYKRTPMVLAVSMLFSALALGVAHLSWMDPQITSLVPVLKSYWLTIHVSVITASYGFLGISASLGIVNLILFIFRNSRGKLYDLTMSELNNYNTMSIIAGLSLLTIGTFLGGIWANESWGTYWSWDPKETWSWITIVVYVLVLHLRFIRGASSVYINSVLSVFAFLSVLMTYLGVNFYLSGLHSYAKGDPVPIPLWAYLLLAFIFVLSAIAYRNRGNLKS